MLEPRHVNKPCPDDKTDKNNDRHRISCCVFLIGISSRDIQKISWVFAQLCLDYYHHGWTRQQLCYIFYNGISNYDICRWWRRPRKMRDNTMRTNLGCRSRFSCVKRMRVRFGTSRRDPWARIIANISRDGQSSANKGSYWWIPSWIYGYRASAWLPTYLEEKVRILYFSFWLRYFSVRGNGWFSNAALIEATRDRIKQLMEMHCCLLELI